MFDLSISVDLIDRAIIQEAIISLGDTLDHLAEEIADEIETRTPHCGIDCDDACRAKHRADIEEDKAALDKLVAVMGDELSADPWDEDGTDPTMPRMLPVPTLEAAKALADVLDHAEYMGMVGDLSVGVDVDPPLTNEHLLERSRDMWHAVHCLWRGIS
jgi:hypothetical protein